MKSSSYCVFLSVAEFVFKKIPSEHQHAQLRMIRQRQRKRWAVGNNSRRGHYRFPNRMDGLRLSFHLYNTLVTAE
jgi:hypothetical protein